MKYRTRHSQCRHGVAMVELALTLPLLLLLMFGAYELSRANMIMHTTESACYEGARLGILPGFSAAECEQACREVLATAGINQAQIQVTPADLNQVTELVSITIRVDYADNTTLAPFFMPGDSTIVRTCELLREVRD